MTEHAPPSAQGSRAPTALSGDQLVHVELTWIEKKQEHWIRFGRQIGDRIIDRHRRVASFPAGAVFAFVRWASNDYGTIFSAIDIVRAAEPGQGYSTLPYVRPGGEILLHSEGWPKVSRVLQAIDAVEALAIDPCDASLDHWRHVHNRLCAGHEPRQYTIERHRAWLQRREIQP